MEDLIYEIQRLPFVHLVEDLYGSTDIQLNVHVDAFLSQSDGREIESIIEDYGYSVVRETFDSLSPSSDIIYFVLTEDWSY